MRFEIDSRRWPRTHALAAAHPQDSLNAVTVFAVPFFAASTQLKYRTVNRLDRFAVSRDAEKDSRA
jgi:hypothetical protein